MDSLFCLVVLQSSIFQLNSLFLDSYKLPTCWTDISLAVWISLEVLFVIWMTLLLWSPACLNWEHWTAPDSDMTCLSIFLSPPGQNWLGVVWLILRLLLFFNKLKSSIFCAFGSFLPEIVTTTVDKNLQCIFSCCQSSEKIYCISDMWRSSYYIFTLFNTKLILLKNALSWYTLKFKPNGARHLTQSQGLKTWPSQPISYWSAWVHASWRIFHLVNRAVFTAYLAYFHSTICYPSGITHFN